MTANNPLQSGRLETSSSLKASTRQASTSSNLVIVPRAPLALFENYFAYKGTAIWNALPEHIRKCNTLHTFKKALRAHGMT